MAGLCLGRERCTHGPANCFAHVGRLILWPSRSLWHWLRPRKSPRGQISLNCPGVLRHSTQGAAAARRLPRWVSASTVNSFLLRFGCASFDLLHPLNDAEFIKMLAQPVNQRCGAFATHRGESGRRGRVAKGLDPAKLAIAPATCGLSNHAPQYARQHVGAGIGCPAAEV